MSINPKSVEFHQCHANPRSICFFITISKITKDIFAKICCQLKTPTRTWKCTRRIMQMSYLYASDFPFKNFCKIAQHTTCIQKQYEKNVWGKSNDAYSLSTRVQSTINHRFRFLRFYHGFLQQYQRQRKYFLSERALEKALRDTLTRAAWLGPSNFWWIFDWFALSMRMQVILESSFALPGWAPIWGWKKGEFRDWTNNASVCKPKILQLDLWSEMFYAKYCLSGPIKWI